MCQATHKMVTEFPGSFECLRLGSQRYICATMVFKVKLHYKIAKGRQVTINRATRVLHSMTIFSMAIANSCSWILLLVKTYCRSQRWSVLEVKLLRWTVGHHQNITWLKSCCDLIVFQSVNKKNTSNDENLISIARLMTLWLRHTICNMALISDMI